MKPKPLLAALVALLLLSAAKETHTLTGKIVGVADGDTVTLLDAQQRATHNPA